MRGGPCRKEFAYHQKLADELSVDCYFAKPYHSWERGANENLNGLVRQYFPKWTSFERVTQQRVDDVVRILNQRPRKRFGYRSPEEVFDRARLCCMAPERLILTYFHLGWIPT